MRSILILAATMISASLAFGYVPERLRETSHNKHHKGENHHTERHIPSEMKISLNRDRLNELMSDFEEFGVVYWDKTRDEREVVIEGLKDAWANTAAKLIFNFGKSVAPVAEEWANIMQYV
jgi:CBS-domain-containing membrane protein